jgi:hypothetical protein
MVSSIFNNGIFRIICIAFYMLHFHLHFHDGFSNSHSCNIKSSKY